MCAGKIRALLPYQPVYSKELSQTIGHLEVGGVEGEAVKLLDIALLYHVFTNRHITGRKKSWMQGEVGHRLGP